MSLPSDSKLLDCTGRGNILVLTLHTSSHWHLKKTGLSQSAPQVSPDSPSEVKAEGLILGLMPFPSYQLIAFPSSVSPNKVRHQILNVLTELLCPSAHTYPCPFGSTIMLSSSNSEGICSGLSFLYLQTLTQSPSLHLSSSFTLHMPALHGREAHIKPVPQQWLGQLFFNFTEFSLQLLRITLLLFDILPFS